MITANLKVYVLGKGEFNLTPNDHIATGGEGSVFLKNNLIFKVFLDPSRAHANGMASKIQLLSKIKHPYIIAPYDLIFDSQHQMIGYYMPLADGIPLMKTFTNSWRDINTFGEKESIQLVENMREAVSAAHAVGAVMVDGNETNYLTSGVKPRIIDIDSWQVGPHKATAIMPSIKDYHAAQFDEGSDWFAWAIVTFQVFTGIHPYKGTHPNFKKGDLEGRMRSNVSVFDPLVKTNTAVRPFNCIPSNLLNWYERVFSNNERSMPPSAFFSASNQITPKRYHLRQAPAGAISHDKIYGFKGTIKHVSSNGICFYQDGLDMNAYDLYRKQDICKLEQSDIISIFANKAALIRYGEGFVLVSISNNSIQGKIIYGSKDPIPPNVATNQLPLSVSKLIVYGNRLFGLNPLSDKGMTEIKLLTLGSNIAIAVGESWPINMLSTKFFDGVAIMDCLGTPFLIVHGDTGVTIQKAKSLTNYKIANGFSRSIHRVWMHGVDRRDGKLYRIELKSTGNEFEKIDTRLIDDNEINIAVSTKGIAVRIEEDCSIEVQNTIGSGIRVVADTSISKEMQLFSMPDGIFYWAGSEIYKLQLS